MSSQIYIMSNK